MSHDGKRPVTLEDLLRLKRAERPAPEFWDRFDRELRAKQLAALVQKRPWWRDLPPVFGSLRRYHLPLGAAAALALTVVAIRNYEPVPSPATSAPGTEVALSGRSDPQPVSEIAIEPNRAELLTSVEVAPATVVAVMATDAPVANSSPAGLGSVIPLIAGTLGASPAAAESTPAARSITANLAAVETGGTRMLLGRVDAFEARLGGNRGNTIEPLQQMTSPAEVRLARYRSPFLVATIGGESNDRTGERIARRISDDRLYDQISRVGARGDRVQVRF